MTGSLGFGVNYTPRRNWYYSWLDWDPGEVAADFDVIAGELGADHVRVQCIWPWFQPNPAWVSPTMLGRLEEMLDLAAERQLRVCITAINGWLSGFDFRPAWLHDAATGQDRNIFSDPFALAAQQTYLAALCDRTAGHPAVWGYDIANEPNVLQRWNPASPEVLDHWCRTLTAVIAERAPGRGAVIGVDHQPWMSADAAPSRSALARLSDPVTVHAWPWFTGALSAFGERHPATARIADFLAQVAIAAQPDGRGPVWVQELGVAPEWVDDLTGFATRLLVATLDTPQVDTVTWWCSHDVDRSLSAFAGLEYDLGLIGKDNRVKPIGRAVAEVVREPRPIKSVRTAALVLPAGTAPDLSVLGAWAVARESLAIVEEQRRDDDEYLRARGIVDLVELADLEETLASP